MLHRFCKWLLKDYLKGLYKQIKSSEDLSYRLATRLKLYAPPLEEDGNCITDRLETQMDISLGLKEDLKLPVGSFTTKTTIIIPQGVAIEGDKDEHTAS